MRNTLAIKKLRPISLILGLSVSLTVGSATYDFQDQPEGEVERSGQFLLSPDDFTHIPMDDEDLRQAQVEQNKSDYQAVLGLIRENRIKDAEKKVSELLETRPNIAVFHDLSALISIINKNPASAEKSYQKAIRLNPKDVMAYLGLAKLSIQDNKLEQAKEYADKAISVNDKSVQTYFLLADIALKQKNTAEVENILETALEKVKGNKAAEIKVVINWGKYYAAKKEPEKILQINEALSKRYPDDIEVTGLLVAAQLVNGQKDAAKHNLYRIVESNKTDISSRVQLARLLSGEVGKEKEVLALLDEAAKINPGNPQANYFKANYLIKLGRIKDALMLAGKMDEQFPKLPLGKVLQGNAYIADKKLDKATKVYREAYRLQSNDRILFVLANLLNEQGKTDEAIKLLDEALAKNPNNLAHHYRIAMFYQAQNKTEQAEKHYLSILTKQPENVLALNNLAWMYAQQGNSKALGLAEKAFANAPKSAVIADTYGYVLLQQGKPDEAIAILEKAVSLAPKASNIQYHLAKSYVANRDLKKATEILEAVVNSQQEFSEKEDAIQLLKKIKAN